MTISNRGAIDAAKRVKGFIQQVFDYALAHGKCSRNSAKDLNLRMLLPKSTKTHYATITDPDELAKLLFTTVHFFQLLLNRCKLLIKNYFYLHFN